MWQDLALLLLAWTFILAPCMVVMNAGPSTSTEEDAAGVEQHPL